MRSSMLTWAVLWTPAWVRAEFVNWATLVFLKWHSPVPVTPEAASSLLLALQSRVILLHL